MNKYIALCTAALAVLSSAAVAGADGDHEAESFEIDNETYYIHESGLYKETNGLKNLQLEGGMANQPYDADERVSPELGP